ncbi:Mitochondrial inner membrane protease ATP23 like protein [Melipona quadrifasciata]|uniref:Mitochondrial inner membrane protease ATP23 n=1 Tax=Melipona quadrifasciata TaxID=166423 RepID=A0A0M9ACW8_9HYME|nr:Mitochondrial inner membrane protease ATP23 like protein [Melipona quadrifasciata]
MTVKNEENEGNFNTEEAEYSDLYPSRKKSQNKISTWFDKITLNKERENYQKLQCEINVFQCMKNSPLMKLLLGALKSSGCEIELGRHISCEVCDEVVTGGYDPETNQNCVIDKAVRSVIAITNISKEEATEAVMQVFNKCYNDLEPIGRRLRRNSLDMEKAYYDGMYYGYIN